MTELRGKKILVVGDNLDLVGSTTEYLRHKNMQAESVTGGAQALATFDQFGPDLVILKFDLTSQELETLRLFRAKSDVSIIVLGESGYEKARIACLELGADDYMNAPFSMAELLARIHAVFRRRLSSSLNNAARVSGKWLFGGFELRLKTRQLLSPSGAPVRLTNREYALLVALVEAAQRPVTREYLLKATRFYEDILDRSVDVQILRLRRKLEDNASVPRLITTKRGIGYVFNLPAVRN